MDLWQAVVLGAIQGITEWLPVSSSGHLVIAEQLLGLESPVSFAILLHFATLLVLCTIYWKDIYQMLRALLQWQKDSEHFMLAKYIVIGSIPTAIIGFSFKDIFEQFFSNLYVVAIALAITGVLLLLTTLTVVRNKEGSSKLHYVSSFLIGAVQGIAIIPGISRSGITISTGLFYGIDKERIARYSFLLSIPAIVGATLFEGINSLGSRSTIPLIPLCAGMISAYVVGYFSLRWLLAVIKTDRFYICAYYCFALSISLILYLSF